MLDSLTVAAFWMALACVCAPCSAQNTPEDQKAIAALKKRAEGRYDQLLRLKNTGVLGETDEGLVAVTKSEYEDDRVDPANAESPTVGAVTADENADRKKLYAIVGRGTKTDFAEVARQAMVVHFKRALPDQYVRVKGKWIKRKDLKLEEKATGEQEKK